MLHHLWLYKICYQLQYRWPESFTTVGKIDIIKVTVDNTGRINSLSITGIIRKRRSRRNMLLRHASSYRTLRLILPTMQCCNGCPESKSIP